MIHVLSSQHGVTNAFLKIWLLSSGFKEKKIDASVKGIMQNFSECNINYSKDTTKVHSYSKDWDLLESGFQFSDSLIVTS